MANRLWRDCGGAALVEFTLVFFLFILVALGTVDATLMMYDWTMANKAAYRGARAAAVTVPPVATNIDFSFEPEDIGELCFDPETGTAQTDICALATATCRSTGCPPYGFDAAAFGDILGVMQQIFPRLQAQNVEITYTTTGLGFAGRPGGQPMTIVVRIRCMTHQFYFLAALMEWVFPQVPPECPATNPGPLLPAFATTLPSEAMGSL